MSKVPNIGVQRNIEYLVCGGFNKEATTCHFTIDGDAPGPADRRHQEEISFELDDVSFHRGIGSLEDVRYNGDGMFSVKMNDGACVYNKDSGRMLCGKEQLVSEMKRSSTIDPIRGH